MRKVVLHIGMHKTGTTSIQNSLHQINSEGFRTVRFQEKNHSAPLYTIFSENRFNHQIWKNQGLTNNQINEKKAEYEKILEEELADDSVNVFLLSGEAMSTLTENEQRNLCLFFKEKNFRISIIYVVRDPISWAASANQQRAKGGARTLSKLKPRYKQRISGFIKGCGQENISIFKYEDLIQKGLIQSFSDIIGFKLEEGERVNESVTSEALTLIYALNNIKIPTKGSKIHFFARQAALKELISFFSKSNGFKKLNLDKFDLVDKSVIEDLVWLKENFGISYSLSAREEQEGIAFEDFPSLECLSEFFGRYSLNYNTTLSLVDNLVNLYMKFLHFSEIDDQRNGLVKEEKWLDALQLSKKAIELGDKRHSSYRKASNISHRLKEVDDAITFAKQAVNAKDNNDITRANHKKYLANLLRIAGRLDDV